MYYEEFAEACALGMPDQNCWKYFKKYDRELLRIVKVLGILKSICPKEILDVGFGRGRSLWPIAYRLQKTKFLCLEKSVKYVRLVNAVHNGGVKRVRAIRKGIEDFESKKRYEVITALEVMEHIPNVQEAMDNIIKLCDKYYIASVPSKPDNNPDHIHFFSEESFKKMIISSVQKHNREIKKLSFEYVLNHMIIFLHLK